MTDTDRPRTRWATPAVIPEGVTDEQAQRVHALHAAREVLEAQQAGGPLTAHSRKAVAVDDLIRLSCYIMDGSAGVLVYDREVDDRWRTSGGLTVTPEQP